MLALQTCHRGITLVEAMITIAILAIITSLGLPSFTHYLQSLAVRTTAESLLAAAQTTRGEAIRSNNTTVLQVVDSLDNACNTTALGRYWVVSHCAAAGHCGDAVNKQASFPENGCTGGTPIILAKGAFDTDERVQIGLNNSTLCYSSLGRINPTASNCPQGSIAPALVAGGILSIDIIHQENNCIANSGPIRCLRLNIGMGGEPKLCDPSVSAVGDPRKC
jgi:type IV fimbrial biogenesis protein FimT